MKTEVGTNVFEKEKQKCNQDEKLDNKKSSII